MHKPTLEVTIKNELGINPEKFFTLFHDKSSEQIAEIFDVKPYQVSRLANKAKVKLPSAKKIRVPKKREPTLIDQFLSMSLFSCDALKEIREELNINWKVSYFGKY